MPPKPRGHSRGRTGRPYRRNRARHKAECKRRNAPCSICKGARGPIDYDAANDREDMAYQPDHVIPWSTLEYGDPRRWDPKYWLPSHAKCNREKQARTGYEVGVRKVQRPQGW